MQALSHKGVTPTVVEDPCRAERHLRSIRWALAAGFSALGPGLLISGLEAGLRACRCGFVYGLLVRPAGVPPAAG